MAAVGTPGISDTHISDTQVKYAVLGAGPTGLGAAWRLSKGTPTGAAPPFLLLDESDTPGGRAASVTTPEGFTFDHGGHVLYPHAECREFVGILEQVVSDWHYSIPIRGVWMDGRIIPTPVQRNIHKLPPRTLAACLWGLWRRSTAKGATAEPNLREYLETHFGKQLTRHVMGPLNEKMWAQPPEFLSSGWSSHRSGSKEKNIADVKIASVLRNLVLQRDDPGWSSATTVRYPLHGGMGRIWQRIFDLIPVTCRRLMTRVDGIQASKRCLQLQNGSTVRYEHLVTSIPLNSLLRLIHDQPELQQLANKFRAAKVQIFGFGLKGAMPSFLRGFHALNILSPAVPFWRVNLPAHFSPGNVPQTGDSWSILCESSLASDSTQGYRGSEIESALRELKLIPAATKIVARFSAEFEHGYPVPFMGRDKLLNQVQRKLEQLGIYSRGRFGGWRYEVSNQDHAFMQGVEVIDRLQRGTAEMTYRKTW